MARTKRYKDEEGRYLAIDDRCDDFCLGWYIPDENDFGAHVGEDAREVEKVLATKEPPESRADFDNWVVIVAVHKLADGVGAHGFYFESMKRAKEALAAANLALLSKNVWPDWALKAKAAGWTPPKNWVP